MPDKIEIYVRREKKLVGQYVSGPISDGVMTHSCLSKKMLEYEKELPEADKQTLQIVSEFADRRDLQVEVFDVSTLKGKLKATARGISKTPTIVAGHERIETELGTDKLIEKLESHFAQTRA